jgi:hypothetical protein
MKELMVTGIICIIIIMAFFCGTEAVDFSNWFGYLNKTNMLATLILISGIAMILALINKFFRCFF